MADTTTKLGKSGKLPPITTTGDDEGAPVKKKVVRKKKKPVADTETAVEGEKKPTPRRRKAAASSSSTAAAGGETTVAPKKKKKKVQSPKRTGDDEVGPSSGRSAASQGEDVAGSKASLISKSTKGGTPRKKKVKKKVKKAPEKSAGDDFFDSTLAADLEDIKEDIVAAKVMDDKDYDKKPYSTESHNLASQPTEKFYIETDGGFKGETKIKFAKRVAEEEKEKAVVREVQQQNTITFALDTLKVFKIIALFCHGLLAGFSAWQIVIAYILLDHGNVDFLDHYRPLAMPVQCMFFFLLAVCTVSACDRFDIANPRRGFILRALTLQNGTISVPIYFAALILSLANSALEDKINLYEKKPMLWNVTSTMNTDLDMWRDLNTARGSLSILGWFVIALAPVVDRLTDNLKAADHIVSKEVELGKSSIA